MQIPKFRFVDAAAQSHAAPTLRSLTLLADQDFAPWSFVTAEGTVKGISVELALNACKNLSVECSIRPLPFADLLPSLQRKDGDVIVSGLRPVPSLLDITTTTRPYFRSFGRFVTRLGSPLQGTDIRAMAGRRIGFVEGSGHAAWLKRYYGRSALTGFKTFDEMGEALRTGAVEAVFGDSMQLAFWLNGTKARNCCSALGKAYVDTETFTRNLMLWVRKSDKSLAEVLDASLDQLEEQGITQQVFAGYLPGPVW